MPNDKELNRRNFLGTGAAGLIALGGINSLAHTQGVKGANERVRVAICGLHGRGMDHLKNYSQVHNAQIAALCDIDENVLRKTLAQMEKMGLPKPVTYGDVRKLLEDKSIDCVSIATPNHWHSLMAIWVARPVRTSIKNPVHNLWEGEQLVAAAKRYNRVVQHGNQSRSDTAVREAVRKATKRVHRGHVYGARALLQMA